MIKNRIELPLNKEVFIRSNISRASLLAILTSPEYQEEFEQHKMDFFVSHLQLCYTEDTKKIAPHFEAYERNFSRLLKLNQVPMDLLSLAKEELLAFFIRVIEKGYYVNLGLNEFYIPGRRWYRKTDFVHVNFVYGVDLKKKVFLLMGFDREIQYSEIDFDNFYLSTQRTIGPTTKINLYRYHYELPVSTKIYLSSTVTILRAYLKGQRRFALSAEEVIDAKEDTILVCGIHIYQYLLKDAHLEGLKSDVRIVYQIYEHKKIMVWFLEHLFKKQIIEAEKYEEIKALYEELIAMCDTLKNLVLWNRVKPRININEKLRELIKKIEIKDRAAVEELLKYLEE